MNNHTYYFDNPLEVAKTVARLVEQSAYACIEKQGVFHWALAGGTTPKQCYALLRNANVDWSKVQVWFGDERCLPVGDAERNDVMADEALLRHVPIPENQVHRIEAEKGANIAAGLYAQELSALAALDLVLLGMGEDGHTASLFPNNPALQDDALAVAVFDAPKAPPERVSMGYTALKAAKKRVVMVTGASKKEAFQRVCDGESLPVHIPNSDWYVSLT
jgi:6-phosphogluconolactonase